jgi:hypothetical protein
LRDASTTQDIDAASQRLRRNPPSVC